MRRLTLPLLVLAAFAGCGRGDFDGDTAAAIPASGPAVMKPPTAAEVAAGYAQFERMTAEPVPVNPRLSYLCRLPSPEMTAGLEKEFGPHATADVTIFMNDLAAGAFRERAKAYPVGAVVVKEKSGRRRPRATSADGAKPHDGVGGMIKRPPGYDPGGGDWEYFYFEDPAKIESGRLASCVQCHAGAAGTDHVFGAWADRPKRPGAGPQ